MHILGAGLSGLICGALNAQSDIYERNAKDFVSHRAVLRFRDDKIARALGLNFRKVTVRKAIWDGMEIQPTPRTANQYSMKVRGVLCDNSMWNVAPSERYIAPDDLHAILADICGNRVTWSCHIDAPMLNELIEGSRPIVSTIPLSILCDLLDYHPNVAYSESATIPLEFKFSPILVDRYRVPNCDLFQTIYYPSPSYAAYRATLTGNLLTIESTEPLMVDETRDIFDSFGLDIDWLNDCVIANHKQSFGKIAPINDPLRKMMLNYITVTYGIYSLGRFATWRNILLDDVYDDIAQIRKMMNISHYDQRLELTK